MTKPYAAYCMAIVVMSISNLVYGFEAHGSSPVPMPAHEAASLNQVYAG